MTFYEQIQRALDRIETSLGEELNIKDLARGSFMSDANFYRYFSALTGFTVKEYIRRRRLSESAVTLISSETTILRIALDAGYESHEAYTRAFKKEFGDNPSSVRNSRRPVHGIKRKILIKEQFMGIIIKELPDLDVAYYRVISKAPEHDAWNHIKSWGKEAGLFDQPYRIFGFNNPSPEEMTMVKDDKGNTFPLAQGNPEYGYEFMISYSGQFSPEEEGRGVDFKKLKGGRFAVMSIGVGCDENDIPRGWGKFLELLEEGNYKMTGRWYEEHLDFDLSPEHPNWRMDLYVEIE